MSAQIGLINRFLHSVFGKYDDLFITVKPRNLLFDGLPLCQNPDGMSKIICKVIKSRNNKAIRELPDGSFLFSFFNHVRRIMIYLHIELEFVFIQLNDVWIITILLNIEKFHR